MVNGPSVPGDERPTTPATNLASSSPVVRVGAHAPPWMALNQSRNEGASDGWNTVSSVPTPSSSPESGRIVASSNQVPSKSDAVQSTPPLPGSQLMFQGSPLASATTSSAFGSWVASTARGAASRAAVRTATPTREAR